DWSSDVCSSDLEVVGDRAAVGDPDADAGGQVGRGLVGAVDADDGGGGVGADPRLGEADQPLGVVVAGDRLGGVDRGAAERAGDVVERVALAGAGGDRALEVVGDRAAVGDPDADAGGQVGRGLVGAVDADDGGGGVGADPRLGEADQPLGVVVAGDRRVGADGEAAGRGGGVVAGVGVARAAGGRGVDRARVRAVDGGPGADRGGPGWR